MALLWSFNVFRAYDITLLLDAPPTIFLLFLFQYRANSHTTSVRIEDEVPILVRYSSMGGDASFPIRTQKIHSQLRSHSSSTSWNLRSVICADQWQRQGYRNVIMALTLEKFQCSWQNKALAIIELLQGIPPPPPDPPPCMLCGGRGMQY